MTESRETRPPAGARAGGLDEASLEEGRVEADGGDAVTPSAPGPLRRWWLAVRPATLWAAVAPVAVGTGCAIGLGCARALPALAALAGALSIQIGTNFANDLFDHERGADTEHRLGPARAVAQGWISPRTMLRATILAFATAALCGIYLASVAGPWVLAIGVASIVSGIAYTGGPYPLGYHGLGDLFVFSFFGVVAVVGTVFVQCGAAPPIAWWASGPVGALATTILAVNNLRDRHTDAVAGKRTLAVRWGARAVRIEVVVLVALAYLVAVALAWQARSAVALLPLVSLPRAVVAVAGVLRRDGAALNRSLGETSRLLLLFSLLFAIALGLGMVKYHSQA
ncbi:MAG TPA: 1,4-dihydroxy-2-naphthoate polyprenyltransferase [Thermoanaerobaculia bacterium]|nr:1,4-dihydroxy-2-naphthoate polyprenyltransferase [Thermoanaerobaculia bacterium]